MPLHRHGGPGTPGRSALPGSCPPWTSRSTSSTEACWQRSPWSRLGRGMLESGSTCTSCPARSNGWATTPSTIGEQVAYLVTGAFQEFHGRLAPRGRGGGEVTEVSRAPCSKGGAPALSDDVTRSAPATGTGCERAGQGPADPPASAPRHECALRSPCAWRSMRRVTCWHGAAPRSRKARISRDLSEAEADGLSRLDEPQPLDCPSPYSPVPARERPGSGRRPISSCTDVLADR